MTKIRSIEADYPRSRMAIYDEAPSGLARNELEPLSSPVQCNLLHFAMSTKIAPAKIASEYGVTWADVMVPLVNREIHVMINAAASELEVQFIPVVIKVGKELLKEYVLLNPTKKVDAVNQDRSIPTIHKVPGFPAARIGYERMVLRSDFPAWGIGRQHDGSSHIVVGDRLAAAVMAHTKKGVRFSP